MINTALVLMEYLNKRICSRMRINYISRSEFPEEVIELVRSELFQSGLALTEDSRFPGCFSINEVLDN